jgi:hypothetical protein
LGIGVALIKASLQCGVGTPKNDPPGSRAVCGEAMCQIGSCCEEGAT